MQTESAGVRCCMLYAVLMSISGMLFVATESSAVLILAALIGTINATGSETAAFLSIQQAILRQTLRHAKKRNTMFALYNMIATFAMAAGVLVSGLSEILQEQYGLTDVDSIKPFFLLYSAISIAVIGIYLALSRKIELQGKITKPLAGTTLSLQSKKIVGKLSGLFAVDSFAGGFVFHSFILVLYSLWC
jgi:MFS family permease